MIKEKAKDKINDFVLIDFCYDLTYLDQVIEFFENIKEKFSSTKTKDYSNGDYGVLDVFINNAGMVETDETRKAYEKTG